MSEVCPDIEGRDLCDGGSLPKEARRVDVSSMPEASTNERGSVQKVRDDAARTLSDRALILVNGDRQDAYGEPVEHATKVAAVWKAMFGWDVDAHRFTVAMAALKLVREANRPKADSRIDTVGWLEIAERIVR